MKSILNLLKKIYDKTFNLHCPECCGRLFIYYAGTMDKWLNTYVNVKRVIKCGYERNFIFRTDV